MERPIISDWIYNQLPEELQFLTKDFNGRERDIVLLSSLTVLSNSFPNVYGIYDGDEVYPQIFLVIIAPPASGKGVMNYSRNILQKVHDAIFSSTYRLYRSCEDEKKKDKTNTDVCPNVQVKILPANISTSEMYSYLGNCDNGLIIIESEADTITSMLKNDWSNYSDILRRVFHHEPLSISRKTDKVFVEVKEPKLAMLVSGTPDQLKPLIQSKENGLYSRFLVYNFDEIAPFKEVFKKDAIDKKKNFKKLGDKIYDTYKKLESRNKKIVFKFSEFQEESFMELIDDIRNSVINKNKENFVPNVHRHGLIFFRIAMILTVLRNIETIHTSDIIECTGEDFITAYSLIEILLEHSEYTFNTIEIGNLSLQDEQILDSLPHFFTRSQLLDIGKQLNIPMRTIDDKISQWKRKKLIKKVDKSTYHKL